MTILTASQYAKKAGVSISMVTKYLNEKGSTKELHGATAVVKLGNTWMITMDGKFSKKEAREKISKKSLK